MSALLIGGAAAGGGLGAALRYLVDSAVTARWRGTFPLGIFLVNVTGSLALGVLVGLVLPDGGAAPGAAAGADSRMLVALLGTGLLGGYTTFSTAALDAVRLARSGERGTALGYTVGTLVVTVFAALVGIALAGVATGIVGGGV